MADHGFTDHVHLVDDPTVGLTIVDTGAGLKVCYHSNQDHALPSGFGLALDDLDGLIGWLEEKRSAMDEPLVVTVRWPHPVSVAAWFRCARRGQVWWPGKTFTIDLSNEADDPEDES